jgi:hypothetical protein
MRKKSKDEKVLISAQYISREFWLRFVDADDAEYKLPYKISKPERLRRLMAKKIEKHEKEGE